MNQRELFLRHVAQTSDTPMMGLDLDIVSASGAILKASDGKEYVDLISGISVSSVGHCHPNVVKAVKEQSEKFMHLMVYGEFNQAPQVNYAAALCQQLPHSLDSIFFTTGGSEAVEGALKLAKRATGRSELVGFKHAYHGSTQGALSMMGDEFFKNAYRPLLPCTRTLSFNAVHDLKQITNQTAAVIVEPIQGEAGVLAATPEFLSALRKTCDQHGVLLIFDEIQTGFGRTGSLFAFEKYGVVPDILVVAKGMGGGMPIGAFISSRQIMLNLTHNPALGHMNTFGGNAVCVAAAMATLKLIIDKNLALRAKELETAILTRLKHPLISQIRLHGALGAIDFGSEDINMRVIRNCLDVGVITDWFLFCPTAMRIAPPLTISDELLDKTIHKIVGVLDTI